MSDVQHFKVGDAVPSDWFEISEPAKVTFGADCSFEIGQDGKRYGTTAPGVWPMVMLFEPEREGANLKIRFVPELVMFSGISGATVFDSTNIDRYSA